jgi:hypothetical protein
MTNREWLSSQDDETIADFIAKGEAYARVLSVTNGADGTIIVKDMITKWLKDEHKEGESNDA